jgi:hypothetical protein
VCNFLNAQLQNLGSSLAHTRLIEFRASDEGLFGRAPNPALALGGALPNDFKKRASNKEHRRVNHFYREKSEPKMAPSGSSHSTFLGSRRVVLPNDC